MVVKNCMIWGNTMIYKLQSWSYTVTWKYILLNTFSTCVIKFFLDDMLFKANLIFKSWRSHVNFEYFSALNWLNWFDIPIQANFLLQLDEKKSHLKIFPSWTDSICFFKLPFPLNFEEQKSHLSIFSLWTEPICLLKLPFNVKF